MDDYIERKKILDFCNQVINRDIDGDNDIVKAFRAFAEYVKALQPAQPESRSFSCGQENDTISRQAAIRWIKTECNPYGKPTLDYETSCRIMEHLDRMPSAQPEQRYTEEELRVFAHGISLSLLSKRSAQHWRYDENTATEIKFLERLYEKVSANMRGGQNE